MISPGKKEYSITSKDGGVDELPEFVQVIGQLAVPAKGPSAAFAIIYTFSFVIHVVQISKYKAWPLLWIVPCACIIFTAGYICREYNAHHSESLGTSAPDQGLLLSAALIFTAGLFPLLIRLFLTLPHFSPRASWLLFFMFNLYICAILSVTAQGAATVFNGTASLSTVHAGVVLLKASIIMQLVLIVVFIIALAVFHRCYSRTKPSDAAQIKRLRLVMATLHISAGLILVRNIFRTVQIFSRTGSAAWMNEDYFWIFDATPMLLVTLLLNAARPAIWFGGNMACCTTDTQGTNL